MEVELKDPILFNKIIKMFSTKKYLTFNITESNLKIQTTDIQFYFLNMEPKFFCCNQNLEFTVNAKYMHKFTEILIDNILRMDNHFLLNTHQFNKAVAKISLPFISTINDECHKINNIHTKLVVKNFKILANLQGIVTYSLRNMGLVLTSNVDEVMDEIYIYDVDIIEQGNLNFTCSNSWVSALDILSDNIENIMVCFGDTMLMVQFLFKAYEDSYFEIQVPKNF